MRITELMDLLRDYPQDWEVELAVIIGTTARRDTESWPLRAISRPISR